MMNSPKKRIGKYLIYMGNPLGSGAFSQVYVGLDEETNKEVAVKILKKDKIMEDEYTKNAFYSEIIISKKLKSPNIICFYDVHQTFNNFYIILELAQSGTLRSMLRTLVRLDEKKTMRCLIQILNGFGELVKNGITHRDLKPQNILIKDDVLKIADFGFAKQYQNQSKALKTMVGTPAYMAPQILCQEKYTYKCDIWSLGVMTYEMLVGKTPWNFTEKTLEGFKKEIITRQITFPPELNISPNMKDFVMGCLNRDESKRFDWERIFLHPLFEQKFAKNFQNKKAGSTQVQFIMANLRMSLHSKNINLSKVLSRYTEKLTKSDFFTLINSLCKELTEEQVGLLFNFIEKDSCVLVDDLTKFFVKYQCRLTGIDLSKKEMESEENSAMRSSKPGIGIFNKLKIIIENKNVNLYKLLQPKKFNKSDILDLHSFGKLIHLIDESVTERQLQVLFRQFDTNSDKILTFEEAYLGICKIAEIVPMEQE